MPFTVAHRTGVKECLSGLWEGLDGKGTVSQYLSSSTLGMVGDVCIYIFYIYIFYSYNYILPTYLPHYLCLHGCSSVSPLAVLVYTFVIPS